MIRPPVRIDSVRKQPMGVCIHTVVCAVQPVVAQRRLAVQWLYVASVPSETPPDQSQSLQYIV